MRITPFVLLALLFGTAACDSDPGSDQSSVQVSFDGLERLTNGYHYEGWLIVDGSPLTTGKFNVSTTGGLESLAGSSIANGEFEVADYEGTASAFVLTIEPSGDTDTVPAASKYLGGDIVGGSASLAASHGSSLGNTHLNDAGSFILATPTNGPNTDETSGIWWLDPTSGSPASALDLPALPSGWAYEGWVVIDGIPVTTGQFQSTSGVDGFDGFSGPSDGPPFPGEDFLTAAPAGLSFPTDLSGRTAVISIEPMPDNDPAPFTLKPLVGQIPASAAPGTLYAMDNNASGFPTGSVTIR